MVAMRARRIPLVLALLLACGPDRTVERGESWIIAPPQSCQALSAGWSVARESLRPLVPEGATPEGLLVLFVASCDESWIADRATGPVRLAAWLVPIEPPADRLGVEGDRAWVAAPRLYTTGELLSLFARHGFEASEAVIAMEVEGSPPTAEVRLGDGAAGVGLRAVFEKDARPFTSGSAMLGTSTTRRGVFFGEEAALRYAADRVELAWSGEPIVGAVLRDPDLVTLDTEFRWAFTFESEPW